MTKKKTALFLILIVGIILKSCSVDKTKPNIIFILADDLGYGELGCYGQTKIKTPYLDKLAREGVRFTSHYSGQTVCSPSRCALMTGMHMGHASVTNNGNYLKDEDVTIAMLLKKAGYKTGMIGKWGLSKGPDLLSSPNNKGFDYWFGYDNQGFAHFYYPEYMWRNELKVEYPENVNIRDNNGEYQVGKGTYSHDEFTKEALQFVSKNANNPFFLYLPYNIPHAELTVPEDSKEAYREFNWPEKPKAEGGGGKKNDAGYGSQYRKGYCAQKEANLTYAAMISRMDRDIGSILNLLDSLNLSRNTLVIFSSDNGPSGEGGQSVDFFQSSGFLKGRKRSVYEGGIRIPFIARWTGKIPAGRISDHPSAFWDFLPTACELAGIEIPVKTDGISYLPELKGDTINQKKHKYLYWKWRNKQVLRVGNWKLLQNNSKDIDPGLKYELYKLDSDISEKHNLAEEKKEIVEQFRVYFDEATK